MRVGILTIHFGRNYGSVLQAYALNKYLNGLGVDTKTLDYIPNRFNFIHKYTSGQGRNILVKVVASILRFPNKYYQYRVFDRFLANNIKLTRRVTTAAALEKIGELLDVLIIGSDQVWNYAYNGQSQNIYYLDFVDGNRTKKVAYAASFGVDDLPENEAKKVKIHLADYSAISVRETTGLHILSRLSFDAEQCIDPVFLLDKEDWTHITMHPSQSEPYIFVYALGGNEKRIIDYAHAVSKKIGIPILYAGFGNLKDNRIKKQYIYASPQEFITLIRNANYVVTNSFHATAFSIIFEKNFITVSREKYNGRLLDILEYCSLESRLFPPKLDDEIPDTVLDNIDYSKINIFIEQKVQFSKEFLNKEVFAQETGDEDNE